MTATESWLVLRAQTGDHQALEQLLRGVHGSLLGFVTRLMRDRAAAEDVIQDTLLIIVQKLRWLENPEAFRPWAHRIAARAAMKALRRERRRFSVIDRQVDLDALEGREASTVDDLVDRLPGMLGSLSPASRAVLVLHYLEGLPLQAVSDILETPLGTVKSRLAYGLQVLRARENAALKLAERNERNHRFAILSGNVLEALLLGTFLLAADFTNRTHVLLLVMFAGALSLLVLAAMALGAFVNRHTLRVLMAVETLRAERTPGA